MENSETEKIGKNYSRMGKMQKFLITLWFLAIFTGGFLIGDSLQDHTKHYPKGIPEIKENPDIKLVMNYIRSRNSKVPKEIAELLAINIVDAAVINKVSHILLVAVIEKESLFNPMAVSSANAKGLMQILQGVNETGNEIEVDPDRAFDIEYNLKTGIEILKGKLKSNKGDLRKALENYSNNQSEYVSNVYENIGRYVMFREKEKEQKSGIEIVENEKEMGEPHRM